MRGATDLPIVVDADTGYGSEAGVWLTVRELEAVGANAVQIEDQVSPKRCGHMEGKEVIPAEEMVIKVRAAVAARRSDETLIIARSDALQVTGLEDTIARCNAYARGRRRPRLRRRAAHGRGVRGDRRALLRARASRTCRRPGRSPAIPTAELEAMGYKLVIFPSTQTWLFAKAYEELCQAVAPRPDDGVARGSLHELRRRQRVARARRVAVAMSARDVYDARGFGGRQGAGERPAVVVVDFIEGFTNPESALACDADAAVERDPVAARRGAGGVACR